MTRQSPKMISISVIIIGELVNRESESENSMTNEKKEEMRNRFRRFSKMTRKYKSECILEFLFADAYFAFANLYSTFHDIILYLD